MSLFKKIKETTAKDIHIDDDFLIIHKGYIKELFQIYKIQGNTNVEKAEKILALLSKRTIVDRDEDALPFIIKIKNINQHLPVFYLIDEYKAKENINKDFIEKTVHENFLKELQKLMPHALRDGNLFYTEVYSYVPCDFDTCRCAVFNPADFKPGFCAVCIEPNDIPKRNSMWDLKESEAIDLLNNVFNYLRDNLFKGKPEQFDTLVERINPKNLEQVIAK